MQEEFQIKKLLIMAAFVAVIGGVASAILGMIMAPLAAMLGGILAAIIALVLLIVMVAKTDIETYDIIELVALLLTVTIVGGIVVMIVPAAAGFILVPNQAFTPTGLAWTFVYVGLAMLVRKMIGR
jgi:hypothetical protein